MKLEPKLFKISITENICLRVGFLTFQLLNNMLVLSFQIFDKIHCDLLLNSVFSWSTCIEYIRLEDRYIHCVSIPKPPCPLTLLGCVIVCKLLLLPKGHCLDSNNRARKFIHKSMIFSFLHCWLIDFQEILMLCIMTEST